MEKLEKQLSTNPSDEILIQYHENKTYIEDYNNDKANGAIMRSKASWAEFGERNSKFFLNLEKRNHNMKCITKLLNEDDIEITNPNDILKYEEMFYRKLYSTPTKNDNEQQDEQNAANFFKDETLPKIQEIDKIKCDSDITLHETGIALKGLQNGKSPGSDGFTPDFYKFFWPTIKNVVFQSIIEADKNKHLSIDQKRGVINLIPKKNKDPRTLQNW